MTPSDRGAEPRETPGAAVPSPPPREHAPARTAPRHAMTVRSGPGLDEAPLAAWVGAALEQGDKVLIRHRAADGARLRRVLGRCGVDEAVLRSSRVELIEAEDLAARCGGGREGLAELYAQLADQAVRNGYRGLALTGDGPALRPWDAAELIGHEHDLERLTAQRPMRALCRYCVGEDGTLLSALLAVHHREVEGETWAASCTGDRLYVRGELDAGNAHRFAAVLGAGIAAGVTAVDVSGLVFCGLAALRAFAAAAEALPPERDLELVGARPYLARTFELSGNAHPRLRMVARGETP